MFGNITGDESTRSSEIDILIRIKNTKFFKSEKGKSTKFSGKLISFAKENNCNALKKFKRGIRIL